MYITSVLTDRKLEDNLVRIICNLQIITALKVILFFHNLVLLVLEEVLASM